MQRIATSRVRALRCGLLVGVLAAVVLGLPVAGPNAAAAQQTLVPAGPAQAAVTTTAASPGAGMTVTLLTFGHGATIEDVWGHNAIRIQDSASGFDASYNWGIYNFDDPGFLVRLARGIMLYSMYGFRSEPDIARYVARNRDIYAQELNLTAAQKVALLERLQINDTDANRVYRYQYYLDNCSTRARDALDAVLGGRIAATLDTVPARETWRWQARRLLRTIPWAYVGMEFALGNPADETIPSALEEGFLPVQLMNHLRRVTVVDEAGNEVPLVASETQLFKANRPPEPETPPFALPWFLGAGLVLALALALAGRVSGRIGAVFAGFWSLVVGGAGLLLLLAWLLTDHTFWYRNENVLQASPVSLLLAAILFAAVLRRGRISSWAVPTALAVLGLSVLGLVVQPLPGFDQFNGELIAAALPIHLAVVWLVVRMRRVSEATAAA